MFQLKMKALRLTLLPIFALGLAACSSVGPKYERPTLDMPETLGKTTSSKKNADKSEQKAAKFEQNWQQWWQVLQDPVLNDLVAESLSKNQDIALALARIAEARATEQVADANRYPTLDANFNASRNRLSENSGKVAPGANPANNDFQLSLAASYEVDFWGKYRSADNAARSRLLAVEANRGIAQSSLAANVVQQYLTLRALDAQLALLKKSEKTRADYLALVQKRFDGGLATTTELNNAKADDLQSKQSVRQMQLTLTNTESALALLLGRTPKEISEPKIARGSKLEQLYKNLQPAAELPSELLQRRPDIIAAEQNLIAANADIGQAKAAYFPSLRLTTSLGRESRVLEDLFNPGSLLWNLASSVTQPLFRAGSIGAVVEGANARKAQAQAQYVQAVQGAFRDVHDALASLRVAEQIRIETEQRLKLQRSTHHMQDLRFQSGVIGQLDVLNAERDLLAAQNNLAESQRSHLAAMVTLCRALGGGWDGVKS